MHNTMMTAVTIGVIALMTWLTRGLPYLIFHNKKQMPPIVEYLGTVLPPSIMVILVVYCLRNVQIQIYPHGLAELISVVLVIGTQLWKKNLFLSIFAGTACYMLLIRTVFI